MRPVGGMESPAHPQRVRRLAGDGVRHHRALRTVSETVPVTVAVPPQQGGGVAKGPPAAAPAPRTRADLAAKGVGAADRARAIRGQVPGRG